jgi:nitroreductase
MERLELTAEELLTTTRAVRKRLDLSRSVERSVVEECLQIALQAPNGSNRQTWNWVVVDDAETRVAMAEIWRGGAADLGAAAAATSVPARPPAERQPQIMESVSWLNEHLHEVPVLVVATVDGRPEGASMFAQSTMWGSVLPAVWSFMLALRSRAMGSCWTTVHLEREQAMADLLGIPIDQVTQVGLFPVAYTVGTDFKPGAREASADTIRWNRW